VPELSCAVHSCDLAESEHWFEYDEWKPHKFEPRVLA
jgi:hypothetical protein